MIPQKKPFVPYFEISLMEASILQLLSPVLMGEDPEDAAHLKGMHSLHPGFHRVVAVIERIGAVDRVEGVPAKLLGPCCSE